MMNAKSEGITNIFPEVEYVSKYMHRSCHKSKTKVQ